MSDRGPKSDPIFKSERAAQSGSNRSHSTTRRLNPKAALILGIIVVCGSVFLFWLKNHQDHNQRSGLMSEAKLFLEQKQPRLALTYLDRYLELNPDDVDAWDLKGKILFDVIRSPEQALAAIPAHEQVVRNDPQHKHQDARRRLVRLDQAVGKLRTAYTLALELLQEPWHPTAEDYRLVGRSLVYLQANGVLKVEAKKGPNAAAAGPDEVNTLDEAIRYYEIAQRLEPGNVEGAGSLATLYLTQSTDATQKAALAKAKTVLDQLLANSKTAADQAVAHSVRYDIFNTYGGPDEASKAQAELAQALQLKPDDPAIRLKAALDALRRGSLEEARQHIEVVPPQTSPEMRNTVLGQVDWTENKIDDALQDWREGLKATGGTSDSLTWRLAFVLLTLGRVDQAKPLVDQYHRLTDRVEPIPKAIFLDALMLLRQDEPEKAIPKLEAIRLKIDDSGATGRRGLDSGQSLAAEVHLTLGQCYERIEKEQEALDSYRQAAKIVRGVRGLRWGDPWSRAASVLVRLNRLEDAAGELEDGLNAVPNNPTLLAQLSRVRLTQQVRTPKEQRNWSAVDKLLKQGLQTAPNSAELHKLEAAYLTTDGRLGEAAAKLEAATSDKNLPQSADLWALRAEVLRRLGQNDEALKVLDQATSQFGEQSSLRVARATVLSGQGSEKAAYDTLVEGAKVVPPDQRAGLWKALGDLHRRMNDATGASAAYAEWARLSPKDPQPALQMLELALAANDEPAIQTAAAAAKKFGGVSKPLAEVLMLLKLPPTLDEKARNAQLKDAERKIDQIVKEHPSKPVGYLLRGQLYELQGRIPDANRAYHDARDHNGGPQAIRALYLLMARHQDVEGLKHLRTELTADELNPELEQLATEIALKAGDKPTADELLREVIKLDPQSVTTNLFKSRTLIRLGRPKEAEETLQSLVQQRPTELAPRVGLLYLQVSQKQFDLAAETVEQIRAKVKTDRPEFVWAGCYWTIGNLIKATENFEVALTKWPHDPEVRQRAISYFLSTNHRDEAEAVLRKLLVQEPKHGWARRELAQILSTHREDPAAWNDALKLVGATASNDDTDEDRLVRGIVLARSLDRTRRQDATVILEQLVEHNPGPVNIMAHDLLARIYLEDGEPGKAYEHARIAATPSTGANEIAFFVELLLYTKKLDEAEKQLGRLDQIEPESLRVLDLRTRIQHAQGKDTQAAKLLESTFTSVEKTLNGETTGRKILELLVGIDQLDTAERVGRRLAELWPKSAWLFGQVLARRGKFPEALKFCQISVDAGAPLEAGRAAASLLTKQPPGAISGPVLNQADAVMTAALKQLPDNPELLFARATILRLQSRYADALQAYRVLQAGNPQNYYVLNNMAWTLSEDLNQPAEGLVQIDKAIGLVGRNPSMLDTRGVILTRLGKFKEAIADLEASAKAAPAAVTYYHLARAYHQAGQKPEFQKNRDLAKKAGLTASQLQPNEQAEMEKLLKE